MDKGQFAPNNYIVYNDKNFTKKYYIDKYTKEISKACRKNMNQIYYDKWLKENKNFAIIWCATEKVDNIPAFKEAMDDILDSFKELLPYNYEFDVTLMWYTTRYFKVMTCLIVKWGYVPHVDGIIWRDEIDYNEYKKITKSCCYF
jgi:hypothetical protein